MKIGISTIQYQSQPYVKMKQFYTFFYTRKDAYGGHLVANPPRLPKNPAERLGRIGVEGTPLYYTEAINGNYIMYAMIHSIVTKIKQIISDIHKEKVTVRNFVKSTFVYLEAPGIAIGAEGSS